MSSRPHIVVADALHPAGIRLLERAPVTFQEVSDRSSLFADLGNADGLIVRSATRVDRELVAAAPQLAVVGRAGVGLDHIDVELLESRGTTVVNTPDANTLAAAEQTIALLLSVARSTPQADTSLKAGAWRRRELTGLELARRRVGIVGLGRIGRAVAKRLQSFDMSVAAYDPYIEDRRFLDLGVRRHETLEAVVDEADVLSIHTPLNAETRGMLARRVLERLPQDAIVLNCARGGLLDESALLELIESGRLWGAGIDVFTEEPRYDPERPEDDAQPLPSLTGVSARLAAHPKVVATPHLGASTRAAQERMSVDVVIAVLRALGIEVTNSSS